MLSFFSSAFVSPRSLSTRGISYMFVTSNRLNVFSFLRFENSVILSNDFWLIGFSLLTNSRSGSIPFCLSVSRSLCNGLVFSSSRCFILFTYDRCVNAVCSVFSSFFSCRADSMNHWFSTSPTVPPISISIMSGFSFCCIVFHVFFISSVMCGMICTVFPRNFPSLSFCISDLMIFPVVMLHSFLHFMLTNLS